MMFFKTGDPSEMSRKGRRRFLERCIDIAPKMLKAHDLLHVELSDYFESEDEMELIRHGKHENERLNEVYKEYKKSLMDIKTLELMMAKFVNYDGRSKPVQRDSNKKSAGLHSS